jgi:UDP-glucose 4-epimerase
MPAGKDTLALKAVPTLVTGGTGKVGRRLVTALLEQGADVSVLTRHPRTARSLWPGKPLQIRGADLTDSSTLGGRLDGIELVFHLASYSPAPRESDVYQAATHWPVTVEGTRNLLDAALAVGVRRIVYLSSVKVMGEGIGAGDGPVDESTPPAPDTLYGRAKLEAERSILAIGESGTMQVCVLRSPMVYGPIGQGNIARMIDAVARNRFPPWPKIHNRRSAIHVLDLVAAAFLAASRPQANGRSYFVTDGKGYSIRWLYEQILRALGRDVPQWTTPYWVLRSAATAGELLEKLSRRRMPLDREGLRKLTGNAWYCSDLIRAELGFKPRHDLEEEIPRMVREYRDTAGFKT